MKRKAFISLSLIFTLLLVVLISCEEEEVNQGPSCKITAPEDGMEFIHKDTIIISVDAIDSDGTIEEVILFVDGDILDFNRDYPYIYDWLIEDVSSGYHSVRATSIDNDGATSFDEVTIKIIQNENAPLAEFKVSLSTGYSPINLHFTDLSTNDPTSWQWDFGDNKTSTFQDPYHIFYDPGVYTVSLTASNSFGSDTETKIDFIITLDGGDIGSFTDSRDGQSYDSTQMGSQTWMLQNLNFDSQIGDWIYDDSSSYGDTYGRLYSWETAHTICPTGWHLPSDSEWRELEMFLGMSQSAAEDLGWRGTDEGGQLKEAGTSHWSGLNLGATNLSGFTALPGGRYYNGDFGDLTDEAYFWSNTQNGSANAWYRKLGNDNNQIGRSDFGDKDYGFSIRCVKN